MKCALFASHALVQVTDNVTLAPDGGFRAYQSSTPVQLSPVMPPAFVGMTQAVEFGTRLRAFPPIVNTLIVPQLKPRATWASSILSDALMLNAWEKDAAPLFITSGPCVTTGRPGPVPIASRLPCSVAVLEPIWSAVSVETAVSVAREIWEQATRIAATARTAMAATRGRAFIVRRLGRFAPSGTRGFR